MAVLCLEPHLQRKIETLERKYKQHDKQFKVVFEAIRQLLEPPVPENPKGRIGFTGEWEKNKGLTVYQT